MFVKEHESSYQQMAKAKTLLNIVHPYTYKQKGETLFFGPLDEYTDKDQKFSQLVKTALDSEVPVLVHRCFNDDTSYFMSGTTLFLDPIYKILFDKRIESFNTPKNGIPIPDENNGKVADEMWEFLSYTFIKHSDLKRKVVGRENILFVGGMLEACLSNCMDYFAENYLSNGEKLFYIPELCPVWDLKQWEKIQPLLTNKGITSITYDHALEMFVK